MKKIILVLVLSSLVQTSFSAVKDWPSEAQTYLESIPEKKLTLNFVVGRALSSADVFQMQKAEMLKAQSVYFSAVSFEDFKMKATYNYFDLRNQPLLPQFMANSTKGWEAKLGVEQFFASGTAVSLEGSHSPKTIGFLSNPSFDAVESKVTLGVSQNLLGDFFGASYRAQKRSAKYAQSSIESGVFAKLEGSTLDVINLFYQAWLKKELTENLWEGKNRKEKLVRILRSQQKRGVIETSDVLQVEGLALNSDLEYVNTKRDLQSIWEKIVVDLKLPRSFLKVDAAEIPMDLDSPEPKASELCEKISFSDLEKNSYQIREIEDLVQSAEEKLSSQKEKLLPDVKLQAAYTANGIQNNIAGAQASSAQTYKDVGNLNYPALTAGVTVSFPLQNRAQKALLLSAQLEYEQARLRKSMLLGDLESKWGLTCKTLKQKMEARDKYKEISQKNKLRVNLDNRRFEVGRIKAFQWVQTEEDEALANLRYKQAEVEVRQVAWDIQRQTGHMMEQMKNQISLKGSDNE